MAPKAPSYVEKIPKKRGRCTSCICFSWKVFTCIISHVMLISLVIGYCLLGSIAFEYLEAEHERNVKSSVQYIRGNLSHELWIYTHEKIDYLREDEWTSNATQRLIEFENQILKTMKTDGWDGVEDPEHQQWTQMGALFYSIIVITTIGYGHIAPKTDAGKIITIFYAIVGIPLMLLCLSNIGDIMASSFRFIYWRICCFVCTREPKRRPRPDFQTFISQSQHSRAISQTRSSNRASMRRLMRISQRSVDPAFDSFHQPKMLHAYSDTDLRYDGDEITPKRISNRSHRFSRPRNRDRFRQDRHTLERERLSERFHRRLINSNSLDRRSRPRSHNTQQSLRAHSMARGEDQFHSKHMANEMLHDFTMTLPASHGHHRSRRNERRAQSVDPRSLNSKHDTPVICNKYAIDALLHRESLTNDRKKRAKSMPRPQNLTKSIYSPSPERESQAFVDSEQRPPGAIPKRLTASERSRFLAPPIAPGQYEDDEEFIELDVPMRRVKRKEKSQLSPSPRIMSPMGFAVHRQARLQRFDEEAMFNDDYIDCASEMSIVRPVPIWLCVFLVIGYIIGGAFYFNHSEPWSFLDSAYFCFITLTTIGFGDFVPAQGLNSSALREPSSWSMANISSNFHVTDQEIKIAGCSVYLLFGISLLAMSFNLVQEEVIANVKNVARQLGILKEEHSDYY